MLPNPNYQKTIKMLKRIFVIALVIGAAVACNNPKQEEATAIATAEFETMAGDLLDKTVTVEGTVMHVCKHGGKKMFISDDRVKIIASDKIAAFDTELEGSDVIIKGIIREEAAPVLAEDTEMTNHDKPVASGVDGEQPADTCEMEAVKPLYVVEVIEVTEKVK